MKTLFAGLLLVAMALGGCARAIELTPDMSQAADKILARIDRQQYVATWREAASIFRDSVAQEDWLRIVNDLREPHGALQERLLRSASAQTDPVNSPDGEYVMVAYDSKFADTVVVETLVLYLEDEDWRMAGYFLKE